MSALDELNKVIGWWEAEQTNPSTAKLTISAETLKHASAELAFLSDSVAKLQTALDAKSDELSQLRTELAEAVEALKPFAEEASHYMLTRHEHGVIADGVEITVGDLRRAAAFLAKHKELTQ